MKQNYNELLLLMKTIDPAVICVQETFSKKKKKKKKRENLNIKNDQLYNCNDQIT